MFNEITDYLHDHARAFLPGRGKDETQQRTAAKVAKEMQLYGVTDEEFIQIFKDKG